MFIDDCIEGTKKLFNSNLKDVYNIGSDEQVSINQMISTIEDIADIKVNKNYLLDKPKGVRGRSSDNVKIKKDLNWVPSTKLKDGLKKTYKWIHNQIISGDNSKTSGTLDGQARTILNDGTLLSSPLNGSWKRDGALIKFYFIDDVSNGAMNFVMCYVFDFLV